MLKHITKFMEYSIDLSDRLVCDLEMILIGGFYPLTGFMTKKEYKSVVNNMRLPSGDIWPMPIVLPISEETKAKIEHEDRIVLRNQSNLPIAWLYISEIYKPDLKKECKEVLGTTDSHHPYVKIIKSYGDDLEKIWYVGGRVECINLPPHYDFADDRLTPQYTSAFFKDNGWNTVVGFQTRNPMHRSHVELTKYALKDTNDPNAKLFLSPIVGITQDCDVDYHTRVRCYKILVDKYYPKDLVKLCLIPLSMRMAGPREALWHALIRKNYGCTHFIVGRDHAAPSSKTKKGEDFYGPYDAHDLLDKYKDKLGIEIIKSKMIVYVQDTKEYMLDDEVPPTMKTLTISGTQQRNLLRKGAEVPEWFSYPEVVAELQKTIVPLHKRGFCVYIIGLSGSGKTTVAKTLESKLKELVTRPITVLDGDIIRKNLSKGLGFDNQGRSDNVRRIGFVASEIVKHRGIVICANIAPYEEDRYYNRKLISKDGGYIEVYVNTPIEICEERDVKGLYKMARKGLIKMFTGVDDPFEEPKEADIVLNDYIDLYGNVDVIINKLKETGFLKN